MNEDTKLVSAQALADALDLSVDTIWRYTRENRIPFIRLGSNHYRYNLYDVASALSMPSSIVQESGTGIVLPNKPYTYQDYLKIPVEQGVRYEILDGELIKEPAAPNIKHQVVSMNLVEILLAYFGKSDPSGMLFHPPIDVTLSDVTVVQPDLVFVSSEQKHILKECCIDGPPTLAIEIASPSSRRKDRFMKLQVYQEAGISHYWVVDPDEQTMQAYSLIDNTYTLVASGIDDDVLEHRDFPGLVIPLADLWQ